MKYEISKYDGISSLVDYKIWMERPAANDGSTRTREFGGGSHSALWSPFPPLRNYGARRHDDGGGYYRGLHPDASRMDISCVRCCLRADLDMRCDVNEPGICSGQERRSPEIDEQ